MSQNTVNVPQLLDMWGSLMIIQHFEMVRGGGGSDGTVILGGRAKGRTSQRIETVHQDQCSCQVLPAFGDGVLHSVKAKVQLLDHVTVTVTNLRCPCNQEVVCWLPHGL